ncbi:MAG TPA: alpha/beta hydrolase [Candidatus Limnocylindria bacterium]|nr:alpha/beta hydrolase [Candidatus Limnocylindria bacterium]
MAEFVISSGEAVHYEYAPPGAAGSTFVFVNALAGSTATWEHPEIGPALRAAGHGTLAWNFRGQALSRTGERTALTPALIVSDLRRLLEALAPPAPILVGLSIGGLFAAQAVLDGAPATALVLINTLRTPSVRLEWINQASVALARLGGTRLVLEANAPHIFNPEQLAAMRGAAFGPAPYQPLRPKDGLYRLFEGSLGADWDFPWERLALPVLNLTGLHDRVFFVAEDVAALAARLPDVRQTVFPDAGHMIPIERPREFARALLAFAHHLAS